MSSNQLTIGDILPDDLKSNYSPEVLNTTVAQAREIVKLGMPAPSDLSQEDVKELNQIYKEYKATGGQGDGDAYWNKSEADNDAYWQSN